jgi:hypothetical protein
MHSQIVGYESNVDSYIFSRYLFKTRIGALFV